MRELAADIRRPKRRKMGSDIVFTLIMFWIELSVTGVMPWVRVSRDSFSFWSVPLYIWLSICAVATLNALGFRVLLNKARDANSRLQIATIVIFIANCMVFASAIAPPSIWLWFIVPFWVLGALVSIIRLLSDLWPDLVKAFRNPLFGWISAAPTPDRGGHNTLAITIECCII